MEIRSSAHGIGMGCHVNRGVCDFLARYEVRVGRSRPGHRNALLITLKISQGFKFRWIRVVHSVPVDFFSRLPLRSCICEQLSRAYTTLESLTDISDG